MEFDDYFHKPTNEFELFVSIANRIQKNFLALHGRWFYIHLNKENKETSSIDEVQDLLKTQDPWRYTYIERDRQACILVRSDKDSVAMLLYGEFQSGHIKVTPEKVNILGGPGKSTLPGYRRSKLTAIQRMQAFGHIKEELKTSRGNKVS